MIQILSRRVLFILLSTMIFGSSWADSSFISDLAVTACFYKSNRDAAKREMTDAKYKVIDYDTNTGAGATSDFVYIGYKTTSEPKNAITLIAIISSTVDGVSEYKNIKYNGKYYDLKPARHFYSSNGDLNQRAGGSYLYLYYSTSHAGEFGEHMYTDLNVSTSYASGVPYFDVSNGALVQVNGVANLNRGQGSKVPDLYLYAPVHNHVSKYEYVNDLEHKHNCKNCRLSIKESHSSNSNTEYRNQTHHWGQCKICNSVLGKQEHVFVRSSTTNTEHSRVCSVCHLLLNDKHQFGSFIPVDETQHMYVCTNHACSYSYMLPHTWGNSTKVIAPATLEREGIIERYCIDCQIAHRETIPRLTSNTNTFRPNEEDEDEDEPDEMIVDEAVADQNQEERFNVYNLQGQCVMHQVTRAEACQQMIPGEVYVINGKPIKRVY